MAGFDFAGALKEGYTETEIADHLAKQNSFDISGARSDGYSDKEILQHLTSGRYGAEKPAAPRSMFIEMPVQAYAGLTVDLPKQVGQALQWLSDDGSFWHKQGKDLQDWADKREYENPDFDPQTEGRGLVGRAFSGAARAIPPSLIGSMVPGAGGAIAAKAAFGAGKAMIGAGVGSAVGSFGLFGASQAEESYQKLIDSGIDQDTARKAGWINLMIEGGGETVGNIAGLKLFGMLGKMVAKEGETAVSAVIRNSTNGEYWTPFLKQLPKTVALETATESGQNFGEVYVENYFGNTKDVQNPWHAAGEGALVALGMTALLAPFGLAGFAKQAKNNQRVADALQDPEKPLAERLGAVKILHDQLLEVDPKAAQAWSENAAFALTTRAPIDLDESTARPGKYWGGAGQPESMPAAMGALAEQRITRQLEADRIADEAAAAKIMQSKTVEEAAAWAQQSIDEVLPSAAAAQDSKRLLEAMEKREQEQQLLAADDADYNRAKLESNVAKSTGLGIIGQKMRAQLGIPEPAETSVNPLENGQKTPVLPQNSTFPQLIDPIGGPIATPAATPAASAIDAAAHTAATSDQNNLPIPTEAQKEAGNYAKGHINVGGLDISVENPAGTKRRPEWPTLEGHYGYVKGVPARAPDKEHVDVFVKPRTPQDYAGTVYVVDQNHANGDFDEPKVMVGYASQAEAEDAYLRNYTKGWESRVRGVSALPMETFRARLQDPAAFLKGQPEGRPLAPRQSPEAPAQQAAATTDEPTVEQLTTSLAALERRLKELKAGKHRIDTVVFRDRAEAIDGAQKAVDVTKLMLEDAKAGRPITRGTVGLGNEESASLNANPEAAPAAVGTAPEHAQVGVDDRELAEIVDEFNAMQKADVAEDEKVTRIWDDPPKNEIVRLANKTKVYHEQHGWMTVDEAKAQIQEWAKHAKAQNKRGNENKDKIVISLFDLSGEWSEPWREAGYQVYRFDIQDDPQFGDVTKMDREYFDEMYGMFEGQDVYAILAACPCTDFASSGARHFAAKDEDGRTVASVKLVHSTMGIIEYFKPAVWALENPVGRIEKLTGLPPWRLSFDPNHLGDPYTKKTLIWGRFNADLPIAPVEPTEGSKMWSQYGGKSQETKNARSVTPPGFAYSFFMANNAVDHPAMALSNKFDMLDRDLIAKALKAGVSEYDITHAVEDFVYQDLDWEGGNQAVRDLIAERGGDGGVTVEPTPEPSAPAPAAKPILINGQTVDKMTLKSLKVAAKSAGSKAKREAAQDELDRRADEKALKERTPAQLARDEKLKKQAEARKVVDVMKDPILVAIAKKGGIDITLRKDIIGDKGNMMVPFVGHLFRTNGMGLDEMATILAQTSLAYLSPAEVDTVDGGSQALSNKISDDFGSKSPKHFSAHATEDRMEDMLADRMADEEARYADEVNQIADDLGVNNPEFISGDVDPFDLSLSDLDNEPANIVLTDLIATASEIDPEAFEVLAIQYGEKSDSEFEQALKGFIDANQRQNEEANRSGETGGAPATGTETDRPAFTLETQTPEQIAEKAAREARGPVPSAEGFALTGQSAPDSMVAGMVRDRVTDLADQQTSDVDTPPNAPQFGPVGEGQGALPAWAQKPTDWRSIWRTLEVSTDKWRIAGLQNANPISPAFPTERDAEKWADSEWALRNSKPAEKAPETPQDAATQKLAAAAEALTQAASAITQAVQGVAPQNNSPVNTPTLEREPLRGDRFTDAQGKEWEVWSSRQGSVEAFPVVGGNMRVNNQDGQFWAISDTARERFPDRRTDFNPKPRERRGPTPQVASPSQLKTFIGIAADSIEKLRKVDVERVLTSNPAIFRASIAAHIREERPDLEQEVDDVLAEQDQLAASQGQSKNPLENEGGFSDQPAAGNDRDSFTVTRLNRETNQAESITFKRGEYVRYRISGQDNFGEITGISHAKSEFKIGNLSYPFGFAYKAERPAEAPGRPTIPLSDAIAASNERTGADLSDIDKIMTLGEHQRLMNNLNSGHMTPEELKLAYQRTEKSQSSIEAELKKLKKDELIKQYGGIRARSTDTKDELIKDAISNMLRDFVLSTGLSYNPMEKDGYLKAVRAKVEAVTAADIAEHADKVAKHRAERAERMAGLKKAIENPETPEEFETFVKYKGAGKLTPEQRVKYDEIVANKNREERQADAARNTTVMAAGEKVDVTIVETKHTQKGHDLFVVQLAKRVDKEDYTRLNSASRKLGGYYSSYAKDGAIPGFQFKTRADAEAFKALVTEGDTAAVKDAAIERKAERGEQKKNAAAQRLSDMADAMEEKGNAALNADRQVNTARRARMAGSAEAEARKTISMAKTLRNLSAALESGEAKHLEGIRHRTQVEALNSRLRQAWYDLIRDKEKNGGLSYNERESMRNAEPTIEAAAYAKLSQLRIPAGDVLGNVERISKVRGYKTFGENLRGWARDSKPDENGNRWINFTVHGAEKYVAVMDKMGDKTEGWQLRDGLEQRRQFERMGIPDSETLRTALREFVQYKGEAPKVNRVKELERALAGNKNIGLDFFPTPKPVAEDLARQLDVGPGMKVLEPSAGKGNLADAVLEVQPDANIDVVEQSGTLREILQAKGYEVAAYDFMDYQPGPVYDRILMNPPFSNGLDADHVRHAYELLKPGGRMIAITGEGIHFRSDAKAKAFREWMAEVGGVDEKLPANTFMDPSEVNTTGAAARVITIDKPGDAQETTSSAEIADTKDNLTPTVEQLDGLLDEDDKDVAAAAVERLYGGSGKWNAETAKTFLGAYAEWLQQGAKDLGNSLTRLFTKIMKAAQNGLLSIAVAMNITVAVPQAPVKLPVTKSTIQVAIERPRADFRGNAASTEAKLVADWAVRNSRQGGKPFLIADKTGGTLYAFDATGSLIGKAPALFGAARGDVMTDEQANKPISQSTAADKITPAGEFRATMETDRAYGQTIDFAKFKNSALAIHRVYLGNPSEQRMARLQSESADDNRISYGCINALPEFVDQVLVPNFQGNSTVYVLPEQSTAQQFFGINDSEYETRPIEVAPDESVAYGADKYAGGASGVVGGGRRRTAAATRRRGNPEPLLPNGDYNTGNEQNDENEVRAPSRARGDQGGAAPQRDLFAAAALQSEADRPPVTVSAVTRGTMRIGFDRLDTPEKAAHAFAAIRKSPFEKFQIIVTDAEDRPLAAWHMFSGTVSQTSVYPREVLSAAYMTPGAKKLWMAHNHPSGAPTPSPADINLTRAIAAGLSRDIGVDYAGHVIIAGEMAHHFDPVNDSVTASRRKGTFKIPAANRKFEIPVLERTITRSQKPGATMDSPTATRQYLKASGIKNPGMLLMDAQNRVIGFWPMTVPEMKKLRTGNTDTGAGQLIKMVGQLNPSSVIFYSPTYDTEFDDAVPNVGALLDTMDIRVLDSLSPDPAGLVISGAEQGKTLNNGVFFSRVAKPAYAVDSNDRPLLAGDGFTLSSPQRYAKVGETTFYEHLIRDEIGNDLGSVSLGWRDGKVSQLTNIRVFDRGQGLGTRIISTLLEHNGRDEELYVRFIQPGRARNFWSKIGVDIFQTDEGEDGTLTQAGFTAAVGGDQAPQGPGSARGRKAEESAADLDGRSEAAGDIESGEKPAIELLAGRHGTEIPNAFAPSNDHREQSAALESALRAQGDEFTITPYALHVNAGDDAPGRQGGSGARDRGRLAERISGLLGKKIVWVTAEGKFSFNGVVVAGGSLSKYIFIDVRTDKPAHVVAGHELTHHMKRDTPEIYESLRRAIGSMLMNQEEYRRRYELGSKATITDINEEIIGDVMGDNFDNPEFWNEVARYSGNGFDRIARQIKIWLDTLLRKLGWMKGLGSEQFVSDVKVARTIMARALADYANRGQSPSGKPSLSFAQAGGDPLWYSELDRKLEQLPLKSASAAQWKATIKALTQKGVKPAEIEAVGINDWLDLQASKGDPFVRELVSESKMLSPAQKAKIKANPGIASDKITKEQIQQFLRENGVQVTETMLGESTPEETGETARRDQLEAMSERQLRNEIDDVLGIWLGDEDLSEGAGSRDDYIDEIIRYEGNDGGRANDGSEKNPTKYGLYQLPGGENYRELLLTLPAKTGKVTGVIKPVRTGPAGLEGELVGAFGPNNEVLGIGNTAGEALAAAERSPFNGSESRTQENFHSSHFDQPNILAHVRFNERTDADGKRVLFLEEMQSDWAQKGRKVGFADPAAKQRMQDLVNQYDALNSERRKLMDEMAAMTGDGGEPFKRGVARQTEIDKQMTAMQSEMDSLRTSIKDPIPSAPFVTNTEAWASLALKRMIRYAAENGFDKIAWTNGAQQVDRYSRALRNSVDSIEWTKTPKGVQLVGYKGRGRGALTAAQETRLEELRSYEFQRTLTGRELEELNGLQSRADQNRTKVVDTTEAEGALSDAIGKSMAQKIISDPNQTGKIEGDDINISDTGMAGFYDRILPSTASKVLAKLGGGKVSTVQFGGKSEVKRNSAGGWYYTMADGGDSTIYGKEEDARADAAKAEMEQTSFDITPALRDRVMQGLPLFARKDADIDGLQLNRNADDGTRYQVIDRQTGKVAGGPYQNRVTARRAVDRLDNEYGGYRYKVEPIAGTMGPTEGGIKFSRVGTAGAVAPALASARTIFDDLTRSDRVLNRVISKFNTPYHLAEIHPDFKPVYQEAQNFTADVSRYASESADMAPDLLPRIESFKDFGKKAPSNEDLARVERAVHLGTLWGGPNPLDGRRWTDEELRTGRTEGAPNMKVFEPLNESQIKLYNEHLASIEKSLSEHSKSLIWKLLKSYKIGLDREQPLANLAEDARMLIEGAISEKSAELELLNDKDWVANELDVAYVDAGEGKAGDRAVAKRKAEISKSIELLTKQIEELEKLTQSVDDIETKTNGLIEHGYSPLMRFGPYAVYVQSLDEAGAVKQDFFGRYDTQMEANRAKRDLAKEFPDSEITTGVMAQETHRLFQGLNLDALSMFAEYITDEDGNSMANNPAVQEFYRLAVSERSALNRQINRKGVPGYSPDIGRGLAQFTVSLAQATARNYHGADMKTLANEIRAGDLKDYAAKYVSYLQDPQEEAQAVRGLLANYYILGSLASGAVNMTQPLLMTAPYLSQKTGWANAMKQLGRAAFEMGTGRKTLTKAEHDAYERAVKDGTVSPQEIHQLRADTQASLLSSSRLWQKLESTAASAGYKLPGRLFMRKAAMLWGSIYSLTEQFNRGVTFIAAYRIAETAGDRSPYAAAVKAVNETQGVYNRANRPIVSRGPVGGVVMTFKQFSIMYLELAKRLYKSDKKAFAVMMLTLMVLAGMEGLPFAEDIEDLIDTIGQWMGFNTNSKKKLRKVATDILGPEMAQMMLHGVSAIPGMPIDVAQRLGAQNLIPGSAIFKISEPDKTRDIVELAGPAAGTAQNFGRAVQGVATGRLGELKWMTPLAIQNAIKGSDMLETGEYRDTKGRKVMATDTVDAIFKGIGFQPSNVATASRRLSENYQDIAIVKTVESAIADKWAHGQYDKKPELVTEARQQLKDWNEKNPETPIRIEPQQIMRRMKELRTSREERFIKSAPKEIRGDIRRDMLQ